MRRHPESDLCLLPASNNAPEHEQRDQCSTGVVTAAVNVHCRAALSFAAGLLTNRAIAAILLVKLCSLHE
jgi:hypothetical protein